jgi:uncharacterized surface protein with fasciclin (FAS1) repeats
MLAEVVPRRAAMLALGSLALVACGGDDHPEPDLLRSIQGSADLRILAEAVTAAGLNETLSAAGPNTLLAPTDAAFAALLTELGLTKEQLLANRPLLTQVLSYHVVPGRVTRAQVPAGKAITPAGGGFFKLDLIGGSLSFNDGRNRMGRVTETDIVVTNGVIHKLDRVMLPANRSLVQAAQAVADFSILVEAVVAADLVGTLSGTGPYTVFAPTNAAFAALLQELGLSKAELLANKPLLSRVLTYHVLPGRVLKADVPVGTAITTVQGETFTVDASLVITDRNGRKSAITATDVFAGNGVIHVVDKVILPKLPNIVELAQSQPQFSILVEAVVAAGLVNALSGPTALTVFAPTNDAFAALLGELGLSKAQLLANTTLLTEVLTYHVLPGRVYRSGVPVGVPITTLGGGRFSVNASLVITDARGRLAAITATDSLALNGVVHTLSRVILPAA